MVLQKIVNFREKARCEKCMSNIIIMDVAYREEMVAPRLDKIYCCKCGKEIKNKEIKNAI
jgi:hypothetical protein